MRPEWAALAAVVLVALRIGSAAAAGPATDTLPGDAAKGKALAQAWCANCHAAEPGGQAPFAGVPKFVDVARLPSTTAASLHAFLVTPHWGDMPAVKLKPEELDAIVAYILSLKVR